MTTREPVVEPIQDGEFGYLVKWTLDLDVARAALYEYLVNDGLGAGAFGEPMEAAAYVFHQPVRRAGYWRWSPCPRTRCWCENPGGYRGHLSEAQAGGQGAFYGVWMDR